MEKIAIVTDSPATLPFELVKKHRIVVVPLQIIMEGKSYRDGVDISPQELYRWMRRTGKTATTSTPSMGDFLSFYRKLSKEADKIVSIHISEDISTTLEAAREAAAEMPGVVKVVDSRAGAMSEGFVVLAAARARDRGASFKEVVAEAKAIVAKVRILIAFDTLEYLAKGGRIPKSVAKVGSLLTLKPIVTIRKGKVGLIGYARGKHQALHRIIKLMKKSVSPSDKLHVDICQADAEDDARRLREMICSEFNCVEVSTSQFTPVMGAHTGPGMVGVNFYPE